MKNSIYNILIIGSIWGIVEATLGYFLHILPFSIGWFFWFPIAMFFINKSYVLTKNYGFVMLTATLASSIKLIDLFLTSNTIKVINPAISIIFEAAAFVLVMSFLKSHKLGFSKILLINFVWRTMFLCFCLTLPKSVFLTTPAANFTSFVEFFFFKNLINTLFIFLSIFLFNRIKVQKLIYKYSKIEEMLNYRFTKPIISVLLLATAVVLKVATA